jgi:signal transduction histidine kinase
MCRRPGLPTIGDMTIRRIAGEALAWFGALLCPVLTAALVPHGGTREAALNTLVPLLASTLVFGLLRRRPLPALVPLLANWFLAESATRSWSVLYASIVTTGLAVGYIVATRSRWVSVPGTLLALVGQLPTGITVARGENFLPGIVLIVLSVAAAWLAGRSVRERREHAEALRTQAAAQAVTAERLRIARDLHDMVAHSIGVIAIQAGVGARVINTQPAEARSALDAIEKTSRETLSGLRHMVTALRGADPGAGSTSGAGSAPLEPTPGLTEVERLAAATGDAGVRVDVQWRGERRPLPPEVDVTAYRVIQEALTNVVRHAGTDRATVVIEVTGDEVLLEIIDEGRGGTADPGFGLLGMRERVGLLHGELTAGPGPEGGFRVRVRLPVPAGVR